MLLLNLIKSIGVMMGVLTLLCCCALVYRKYLQAEITKKRIIRSPQGIDLLEAVKIGGIDQWIQIRGKNINNPLLLFLHGGPGSAMMPMASVFQNDWESDVTVVQWDQRGAGKTYTANDKKLLRNTITMQQVYADALEIVDYLRARFNKDKIFVLGHSWGSVLGLRLAYEHPELLYAYIGVGQTTNIQKSEAVGYQRVLEMARKQHQTKAIQELEKIAPYPLSHVKLKDILLVRKWKSRLWEPGVRKKRLLRVFKALFAAPEYSTLDSLNYFLGLLLSLRALLRELMNFDLEELGYNLQIPVFFFHGKNDSFTPGELVLEYFKKIQAPQKDFIWFEHSGHFPFIEEKTLFWHEFIYRVLPCAGMIRGNHNLIFSRSASK